MKGGDGDMVEWLIEHGFVVRHLFGNWYLVRLYADRSNPLHHIVFPTRLVDKKDKCETFTLTEEQREDLHRRYGDG